jgi:hypothetical protein
MSRSQGRTPVLAGRPFRGVFSVALCLWQPGV